jgi:two-component system sensor histidine kinase QseC
MPLSPIKDGFSDTTIGGARWRVFSTWDAQDRVLVQVAEHFYERDELATAVARNLMIPLAIALPVLGVVMWAAVVGRCGRSRTSTSRWRRGPQIT